MKAEGARECAERTWNIVAILVTLDVSKVSGWLNADARCRVGRRGVRCGARCGPGGGRIWAGGSARSACTARGAGCEGWVGLGHAHDEHIAHVRDAGRVEAQRLVERRRGLPSRKAGVCDAMREVRAERRGVGGNGGASSVYGDGPTEARGPGHARTLNIKLISVTPEVFQLEISASKFCRL